VVAIGGIDYDLNLCSNSLSEPLLIGIQYALSQTYHLTVKSLNYSLRVNIF